MAETLLPVGVEKLWDLLARESVRLRGFKKQFDELKKDLILLRSYLKGADSKKQKDEMVKICVEDIKEIVLDTEDLIETFLRKKALGKTSITKRMRRFSCIIVDRLKFVSDMGDIHERISKVIYKMIGFGVHQMNVDEGESSSSLQERQRKVRITFPSNNENNLVGLEKNVKKLVGYLVEEDNIQVVSITGMGGIGKTTLARQVFNHEMVKKHFDRVAWVCITQKCKRTYVWKTIMQQLSSKHDEQRDTNMSEEVLHKELFGLLETSNSLIVLDDIWNEEDWDSIKSVFPSKKGWKILFTSRKENVALHAYPMCITFKPECLTAEDSWTLFRRITTNIEVDVKMEEMGKQMIKHCGRLPLAVKVLGGLLAAQHSLSDWKRISENIKSHIVGETNFNARSISSVYHLLYLSFEELPIYLKHCFLYLAHFPEDHSIRVRDLFYYWEAEGIPRPSHYKGSTIKEVGNGYIEELVKRNMVISKRDPRTSRFKTCHLHDMMRQVCLRKAEEEKFVHVIDTTNSHAPYKSRRIAIHQHDETYLKWVMQNPKLRTLLIIYDNCRWKNCMEIGLGFTRLQLMRVLNLSRVEFEEGKLPSSIGKLIHLRYLSLYEAYVTHLPSSMRNLKQLLYLNLATKGKSHIPNFLKEMRELAYLSLPLEMHDETKLKLSNLEKLETLKCFSTKNSSVEDFRGMVKLRSLSIILSKETSLETLSTSIGGLRHLEDLRITDDWFQLDENLIKRRYMFFGTFSRRKEEKVVSDYIHPIRLILEICIPRLQHFPSQLTSLVLNQCCLQEDPMPILEKLVKLKVLKLWNDSFSGTRMVCSSGGFPQLQELRIKGLKDWEEWIVEEGSMPLLHTLGIWRCDKLEVPNGLRFLSSLKDLMVDW